MRSSLANAPIDAGDIGAIAVDSLRLVTQPCHARRLDPARIMHARNRRMLRAELWIRIPAAVEQHQQRLDTCASRRWSRNSIDPPFEAGGILLPKLIMQEHAHRVHADPLGPSRARGRCACRIPSLGLPHLQLIDRGGRECSWNQPAMAACSYHAFACAWPSIALARGRPASPPTVSDGRRDAQKSVSPIRFIKGLS